MARYWFECKVAYERAAENQGMKKISELYLIDALSFTEAEERIIKEILPLVAVGDLDVVNIKRVKLAELFLNDTLEDDKYYRARVNFITIDEKSGVEKKAGVNMIIKSQTLSKALQTLEEQMEQQLGDYEIASITDTQILDVFAYEAPSKA